MSINLLILYRCGTCTVGTFIDNLIIISYFNEEMISVDDDTELFETIYIFNVKELHTYNYASIV